MIVRMYMDSKGNIMGTLDQEFEDLEERIGAETIDCREITTREMRVWFFHTYGYMADDCEVLKEWKVNNV